MSSGMVMTGELRLGLCCLFLEQPIRFRTTTVTAIGRMERSAALLKLSDLCLANADALLAALRFCDANGIGCFRVTSQILPVKTHPLSGYNVADLPEGAEIERRFRLCGQFVRDTGLRTCFHPDQFVVLSSPRPEVVQQSIAELEYQAEVSEWIGADVLNIHGGGAYGDPAAALDRFAGSLSRLSERVRNRLTVENDDTTYTPSQLLPLCRAEGIPLVYDVHHHRCHPDELSVEAAIDAAWDTWNREPLMHISSPIEGWEGRKLKPHHDYISIIDVPDCWRGRAMTVEVEAKAKELAVLKLKRELTDRWVVYILRCRDGSLYTGVTNELARRVAMHNDGKAARYTRGRGPVEVVYQEPQPHRSSALKRELAIKALSREAKDRLIALGCAEAGL